MLRCTVIVSVAVTPLLAAQSVPPAFRDVDAQLRSAADSARAPAVAVAVARHGRILWEAAYGFSDAARSTPATPNTPFAVASVAKSVTATALMRLVERGAIDLDRTVDSYVPGAVRVLQGDPRKVTVRALATMTAGIPHLSRHRWMSGTQPPPADLAFESTAAFAAFPPGTFMYSNWSFGVLSRVMEAATGRPFADIVASEVFRPLGMSNSFFADGVGQRPMAVRLDGSGNVVEGYSHTESVAGASLVASAHDLALFGALHAGRPVGRKAILKRGTLERMHSPAGPGSIYGIGIWAFSGTLVADGSVLGGAGIVKMLPSEGLVAVVVTNAASNDPPTYRFVDRLLEAALSSEGKRMPQQAGPPPDDRRAFAADVATAGRWIGDLELADGAQRLAIDVTGDSIVVRAGDGAAQRATQARFEGDLLRFTFPVTVAGVATPHTATLAIRGDTISGIAAPPATRHGLGLPRPLRVVREPKGGA